MRNPTSFMKEEYEELVKSDLDWKIRELEGPSTAWCMVDGKKVLMFCSNNYLGLSNHPRLKEAAIEAVQTHGAGSGSVRPIAGTMDIHLELERATGPVQGGARLPGLPDRFRHQCRPDPAAGREGRHHHQRRTEPWQHHRRGEALIRRPGGLPARGRR